MNKTTIFFLLILLATLSLGGTFAYADEDKDENEVKPSRILEIFDNLNSKTFEIEGEGKNKTQFRIKNNHNDENAEFMLKGVITSFSSDSLVIDGKTIIIDSSVTEELKIVGKIEVGAYAMVKGKIIDSKYYAQKIVVNQRNKNDIEENEDDDEDDEIASPSATPTPTIALDDEEDENATQAAKLYFENIINAIQNFLDYLKGLASKI